MLITSWCYFSNRMMGVLFLRLHCVDPDPPKTCWGLFLPPIPLPPLCAGESQGRNGSREKQCLATSFPVCARIHFEGLNLCSNTYPDGWPPLASFVGSLQVWAATMHPGQFDVFPYPEGVRCDPPHPPGRLSVHCDHHHHLLLTGLPVSPQSTERDHRSLGRGGHNAVRLHPQQRGLVP